MKKYITIVKWILALTILVSVGLFLRATDFKLVIDQLRNIGWGFAAILGISSMAYFLGALAWKYCFSHPSSVSIWSLLYARTIGENIALFNPTSIVAGEAVKYTLIKPEVESPEDAFNSIILSRVFLIGTQLFLALICLFWLLDIDDLSLMGFWTCGIITVLIALFYLVIQLFTRERLSNCFKKYASVANFIMRVKSVWTGVLSHFRQYQTHVALAISISFIHWAMGAAELCVILYFLDITPHFFAAMSLDMGVVIIKSLAGFIPGQVGIEELGNKWMLSLIGVQGATLWISVSIVRRAKQLFWLVVSAIIYFIPQLLNRKKKLKYGTIIHHT